MSISDQNMPLRSELSSDPDMVELIQMFLAELPERIRSIDDAFRTGQIDTLKRLTHQMKGAAAGYGYASIGNAAGVVEDRIRQLGGALGATGTNGTQVMETVRDQVKELTALCHRAVLAK